MNDDERGWVTVLGFLAELVTFWLVILALVAFGFIAAASQAKP